MAYGHIASYSSEKRKLEPGILRQLDLAFLSVHIIILVVIVIIKAAAASLVIILQLQPKLISQGIPTPSSPKELLLISCVCIIGLVSLHCMLSCPPKTASQA